MSRIRYYLREKGEPEFRFRQIVTAWRACQVVTFERIPGLPKALCDDLISSFGPRLNPLTVLESQSDHDVEKVLFQCSDGREVETVLSHFQRGWDSICISSQVGCGLGCTFCATGAIGLLRNLSADEIVAQVMHPHWREEGHSRPASVAFMGMGEALANPHVFEALSMLTDTRYCGFSQRRLTVSTVGFVPNLARLLREFPQVRVTLSVHSPFPDERAELIPMERRFPLKRNLDLLDRYVATHHRKVYLAYLLIAGVNDDDRHLRELARLVHERAVPNLFHVNVIGYNEAIGANPGFRAPSSAHVRHFIEGLSERDVHVTRRRQLGSGIDAACGQLHAKYHLERPAFHDDSGSPFRRTGR